MRSILVPAFLLSHVLLASPVFAAEVAAAATALVIPSKPVPVMRLGSAVLPLAYELDLRIVPEQDQFQGKITIELELKEDTDFFWMNGNELKLQSAQLSQNGQLYSAQIVAEQKEFIGLQFAQKLKKGKGKLLISYRGEFSKTNTSGLFKQKDGANWYVLSQFESSHARRAFPCFDEPHWKTPWRIAITHQAEHRAASNMPVESVQTLADGMVRQQFASTPPLPSYLIALGVGPFDVVDGGKAGRKGTELRYFVPKGRASEAQYARQVTPQVLALAEQYFDSPYPFAKLDSMVIPITVNFSAMENVGLITYRAGAILAKAGQEPEDFKQKYVGISAHEIAHQWFGDLVTMHWWDDLWLNESFATWMGNKLFGQFNPTWDSGIEQSRSRVRAMEIDRLQSTRQIRQEVNQPDDLANAFDEITYDKGGAVLRMFETYLGPEKFRAGVQRYLKKHAFANASAQDFFAALADSDAGLAQAFAGFVQQPGLPLLNMEIDCSGKQPQLQVRQKRFFASAGLAEAQAQQWRVPLCVRYQGQSGDAPVCHMLEQIESKFPIPANTCPSWVLPNALGEGYYLSLLPGKQLAALQEAKLDVPASLGLAAELTLLASSGQVAWPQLLPWLSKLAQDTRPEVAWAGLHALQKLPVDWLDQAGNAGRARWLQTQLAGKAREMGWLSRPNDSDNVNRVRAELMLLMATQGQDAAVRQEATQLAKQWLTAVASKQKAPEFGILLRPILKAAAEQGDQVLLDLMLQAAQQTDNARLRYLIFIGIGAFNQSALRTQALLHMLDDQFDLRESTAILWQMSENSAASMDVLQVLQTKMQLIQAKMPERFRRQFATHWSSHV